MILYTVDSRVRYSELDETGHMSLPALLAWLQDSALFHSQDVGCGLQDFAQKGRIWVVSSWQLQIERFPVFGEAFTVGTGAWDFRRAEGLRDFLFTSPDGTPWARAASTWTLISTETGRPVRATPEDTEPYGLITPLTMERAPRRITLPPDLQPAGKVLIQPHHLDTNRHVNNGWYVQMALDALPEKPAVREVRVEYHRQARLGDTVIPFMGRTENGAAVDLRGEDGKSYARVLFFTK